MIGLKTKHVDCRITFKLLVYLYILYTFVTYNVFSKLKRKIIPYYKFFKFISSDIRTIYALVEVEVVIKTAMLSGFI